MSDGCLKILLAHGWAGNPALWARTGSRLADMLLPVRLEWTAVNLGYFGPITPCHGHFDIAVGHSAGLAWLLQASGARFDRLVSMAGFTRFCRSDGFAAGWSSRVIRRMCGRLADDPMSVVQDFWDQASTGRPGLENFPGPREAGDTARLQSGLQALSSVDCREQWNRFSGPRQVVAGTEDRIVDADHTLACFPTERIEWIKTDSHWLPWTFPETCAALLHEIIQER